MPRDVLGNDPSVNGSVVGAVTSVNAIHVHTARIEKLDVVAFTVIDVSAVNKPNSK